MEVVLVLGVVVLAAGVLAGSLLTFPAMWHGFRAQWEWFPPGARRRGVAAGALTALFMVIASVLAIAAPWGPSSALYVIGFFGGAGTLLGLIGVATEARRARRRRPNR